MPFNVPLSRVLRKAGWRAKVFDEEGPEIPHVTIQFKTDQFWRVSLRDGTFVVPPGGRWADIPDRNQDRHRKQLGTTAGVLEQTESPQSD